MPKEIAEQVEEENQENNDNQEQENQEQAKENQDGGSETKTDDNPEENNEADNSEDTKVFESVKDSSGGLYDTTSSIEAVAVAQEKLDNAHKAGGADTTNFYDNLDKYLTKDEMELKFDDKSTAKYYQAIEKAKAKWETDNSKPTQELEAALKKEQENLSVSQAIESTLKKYPDYNHVKLASFYNDELNNIEKRKLDKGSDFKNLGSYFEKIYNLYKEKYPTKVKDNKAPEMPNINNKPNQTVDADIEIKSEKEEKSYMDNIGFRKL